MKFLFAARFGISHRYGTFYVTSLVTLTFDHLTNDLSVQCAVCTRKYLAMFVYVRFQESAGRPIHTTVIAE